MVLNILQWNLNGYHNNYNEFSLLLNTYFPHVLALQKNHLKDKPNNSSIPKKYAKHSSSAVAKHGVAFLVSNKISYKVIRLNTNLEAIAPEISAKNPLLL